MENQKPILELELYLIRHGQSMGNKGYGRDDITLREAADPVLTDLGKAQAEALGRFYSGTNFDAVYSSGLMRAAETATELLKYQSSFKPLNILPLLTEVGLTPDYEGLNINQIKETINPNAVVAEGFDSEKLLLCYNQGSDEEGLYQRAKATVDYIRKKYKKGEKVALVSHAAFLTYVIFYLMEFRKNPAFDVSVFNTGVTKINFYTEGTNKYGDTVFDYLNSTTHLLGLETSN